VAEPLAVCPRPALTNEGSTDGAGERPTGGACEDSIGVAYGGEATELAGSVAELGHKGDIGSTELASAKL
jgi:hypothetical protein